MNVSAAVEQWSCGIILFDDGLRIHFANARAGELFGIDPQRLLNRSVREIDAEFRDLMGGEIPEKERPLRRSASRLTEPTGRKLTIRRPDDTLFPVNLKACPIVDQGRLRGMVVEFAAVRPETKTDRLASEEDVRRFLCSLDEIVFEFDMEGRYRHVWSGDESLLKRPGRELVGERVDKVVSAELAEKIYSAFERIRATGEPESFEYPLEVLGGVRWFLARIALVPRNGGREPTFSYVARDITGMKELEWSLRESQRRFRGLFENAATGMALVGFDGRCLEANACLCNMLDYSLEELRRLPFSAYSHPEDNRADLEQFERLGRGEINAYRHEKRFIRKDGKELWGLLTVAAQRDEHGKVLYSIAVVENITRMKQVEAEKDLLLQELEAIFASAADGIVFYDEEGRIVRLNPAAREIIGIAENAVGMSLAEQFAVAVPRRPDGTLLPMRESGLYPALHGTPRKGEMVQLRRRDGRQAWISYSTSPIFDATGRHTGTVGTFADITRQRELQERLENFLHMLAHDLRTPLTVISGHAQLLQAALRGTPLEEKGLGGTRAILNASDQMEQMMEEMVDFGRLESGQVSLQFELVDLREFLLDFLARQVAPPYRRVRVEVPPGLPPIRIGSHHLERILGNVIGNALKYSGEEQPVDIIGSGADRQVCLTVQDYGEGIPPEELPHVFERFYRAEPGRKKTGTGLGLYIARLLVESYGGTIRAESEPEKGSRFILCFPETPAGI